MKQVASFIFLLFSLPVFSQTSPYNVIWTSQSINSSESMPCGGGDIGLNVWVEKGDVLFYISRSGSFDENNALLKAGRVRLRLSPNPFEGSSFKQEMILKDGYIKITGSNKGVEATVNIWVDVFNPVVHADISSNKPVKAEAYYESWRYRDRASFGKANNANSYKWAPQGEVKTFKDEISFYNDGVIFYHRNKSETVFDVTVKQQGMEAVKHQMFNPLKELTFGGFMKGKNMISSGKSSGKYIDTDYEGWKLQSKTASRTNEIAVYLTTGQFTSVDQWQSSLNQVIESRSSFQKSKDWWSGFWDRSYIHINPDKPDSELWDVGRNYQLFRYMLACNENGLYPTKFNGGLFTVDPSFTDTTLKYTPDFRNWGGGTHTAQNQRLVYWPMIKSGDFKMMVPQFRFYQQSLKNAELRSAVYWGHKGACFTEQIENFGLPNPAEYGWNRPANFDKGIEYNAWLEYEWDTVLEFCLMMLDVERYAGTWHREQLSFIESCLTFFNEHYQYRGRQRGRKALDENGHLVLYPGSAAETYKMAYNATSTIAALKTVLERMLALPERYMATTTKQKFDSMLHRIPPISFSSFGGHKTIAPAKLWERVNNSETPQLYPVFPWGMYGIGKPDIDVAINTYKYDTSAVKYRSHVGWKQDNIFAARLGLTAEAAKFTLMKLKNSQRRFPAFWGPGYDWTPDHNWGGSGMIGLQEMLMQVDDKKIYLFPAWPKDWDVHFKLCAPYQTSVEARLRNGKVEIIKVIPEERGKDIINLY